jgi:hypothetical protein
MVIIIRQRFESWDYNFRLENEMKTLLVVGLTVFRVIFLFLIEISMYKLVGPRKSFSWLFMLRSFLSKHKIYRIKLWTDHNRNVNEDLYPRGILSTIWFCVTIVFCQSFDFCTTVRENLLRHSNFTITITTLLGPTTSNPQPPSITNNFVMIIQPQNGFNP